MQTRDMLGFALIPLALVVAAWAINAFALWDSLANITLPWLCTAIAVSMLLLGAVCLILQVPPAAVPTGTVIWVVLGTLAIFGVGMIIDLLVYRRGSEFIASVAGWLGFALILVATFALPRRRAAVLPASK